MRHSLSVSTASPLPVILLFLRMLRHDASEEVPTSATMASLKTLGPGGSPQSSSCRRISKDCGSPREAAQSTAAGYAGDILDEQLNGHRTRSARAESIALLEQWGSRGKPRHRLKHSGTKSLRISDQVIPGVKVTYVAEARSRASAAK